MSRRIYLDTSAYVASLLNESTASFVRDLVRNASVLSSVLLLAEAWRTVVRLSREGQLDATEYLHSVRQIETDGESFGLSLVTQELCTSNQIPTITIPRTLDLIHLRTALWFHAEEPLTAFLSLDAQQNRAAEELGLPVARRLPSK